MDDASQELLVGENGWVIKPGPDRPPDSFGAAVGGNIQRLRAARGMTQTVFARLLRTTAGDSGSWTKSNVAALERGARPRVTVGEAVLFACVLQVPIAELFAGDGELAEPNGASISRADLRTALSTPVAPNAVDDSADSIAPWISGKFDGIAVEIAERLGVSIHAVISASARRYGRTATAEHAARVGSLSDPSSQSAAVKRGNVTRQLVAELKEDIAQEEGVKA